MYLTETTNHNWPGVRTYVTLLSVHHKSQQPRELSFKNWVEREGKDHLLTDLISSSTWEEEAVTQSLTKYSMQLEKVGQIPLFPLKQIYSGATNTKSRTENKSTAWTLGCSPEEESLGLHNSMLAGCLLDNRF